MAQDDDVNVEEFTVLLAGDSAAGKTSLMKTLLTNNFPKQHASTATPTVYPLDFNTTCGPIRFNCIEAPSQDRQARLKLYRKAEAVLLLYDLTNPEPAKDLKVWVQEVQGNHIPVVAVCGNKLDKAADRNGRAASALVRERNLDHFVISVKTFENVELPFKFLARRLMQNDSLEIQDDDEAEQRGAGEPMGIRDGHAAAPGDPAGSRTPVAQTPGAHTPAPVPGAAVLPAPVTDPKTDAPSSPSFMASPALSSPSLNGLGSANSSRRSHRAREAGGQGVSLLQLAAATPTPDR